MRVGPEAETDPNSLRNDWAIRALIRTNVALASVMAVLGGGVTIHKLQEAEAQKSESANLCSNPSLASEQAVETMFSQPVSQDTLRAYERRAERVNEQVKELDAMPVRTAAEQRSFLRTVTAILEPNHVSIETDDHVPHTDAEAKFRPAVSDQLRTKTGKEAVEAMAIGWAHLPPEYVAYSGVKKIRLYVNKRSRILASADLSAKTMNYNLISAAAYTIPAHELGHFIDHKLCPFTKKDPAFKNLNEGQIYQGYNSYHTSHKGSNYRNDASMLVNSSDKFFHKIDAFNRARYLAYTHHDHHQFKAVTQRLRAFLAGAKVISKYSLTTPREDKAELLSVVGKPDGMQEVLDPTTPTIRKKFLFLMARLYEKRPDLAEEFAGYAFRPKPSGNYIANINYSRPIEKLGPTGGKTN